MKKHYKILFDENPFQLEDKVNEALSKGFELVGGPVIAKLNRKRMVSTFNQAVLWTHPTKPAPSLS